ncbi:hypothetical protein [Asticcacaulis sp.]|uniref:hypothetical protein n=1 Tax=Asticcacaulis sp. TaxID=1872648 RepID=UPI0026344C0D|nr:hypothetical protein [Asticcacaulis sp.]
MAARIEPVDSEDLADAVARIEAAANFILPADAFRSDHELTLGEVFDRLWDGLPESEKRGGKCPTLLVFLRIKEWCAARGYTVRPDTLLSDLPGFDYGKFRTDFRRAGWVTGPHDGGLSFYAGCLAAFIAAYILWPVSGLDLFWTLVVFIVSAYAVSQLNITIGMPKAWTVAQLTRHVAYRNIDRLRREGASLHRKFIWGYFDEHLGAGKGRLRREATLI